MAMSLESLRQKAAKYENGLHEHRSVDLEGMPHREVDICAHLHSEVSELFDVIRHKKGDHGESAREGAIDELQDILCIWMLAVNLIVPDADLDDMIRGAESIMDRVLEKKLKQQTQV